MSVITEFAPVIRYTEVGRTIYVGIADAKSLAGATYVLDVDYDQDRGYQRPPDRRRMRRFAEYLQEPGSFVTPLVLNAGGKWEFVPLYKNDNLGKLVVRGQASIVDGQHRDGGIKIFAEDNGNIPVPFMAFDDLEYAAEAQAFKIINDTARKVSTSLVDFIDRRSDINVTVALKLDRDKNSPLHGNISWSGNRDASRRVTLEGMRRGLVRLFNQTTLASLSETQRAFLVKDFFRAIAGRWPKEWVEPKTYKLWELTGIFGLMVFAAGTLPQLVGSDGRLDIERLRAQLAKVNIDWRKKGRREDAGGNSVENEDEGEYKPSQFEGTSGAAGGEKIAQAMFEALGQSAGSSP